MNLCGFLPKLITYNMGVVFRQIWCFKFNVTIRFPIGDHLSNVKIDRIELELNSRIVTFWGLSFTLILHCVDYRMSCFIGSTFRRYWHNLFREMSSFGWCQGLLTPIYTKPHFWLIFSFQMTIRWHEESFFNQFQRFEYIDIINF